jgi:hypothetical protein
LPTQTTTGRNASARKRIERVVQMLTKSKPEPVPNPPLLSIVRSSQLFLLCNGVGNEHRFAGLFGATWRRIPLWARRQLVKYWRTDQHRVMAGLFRAPRGQTLHVGVSIPASWTISPRIEIQNDLFDFHSGQSCYGRVTRAGHLLEFHVQMTDAMPDAVVQDVIAHELAHCVQWSSGYMSEYWEVCKDIENADIPAGWPARIFDPKETDADEMINVWGFDSDSVDVWHQATQHDSK